MTPTPEELAAQEAKAAEDAKAAEEAKAAAPKGPVVLQGEHIPEALRGKTDKELVELLLNTSTELEKHRGILQQKDLEIQQLKPRPPTDQMTEAEKKALREKEFIQDPIAFIEKHHEDRVRPLTEEYFKGQAEVQLQICKSDKERYPDFTALEKPVRAYLEQMPIEVRANPVAIDFAYKMAEYPELKKQLKEGASRVGLHVQGQGNPPPTQPTKRTLDEEEKIVAARFGLTEEDYVKYSGKGNIDEFK